MSEIFLCAQASFWAGGWLPGAFAFLLGLSLLIYAVLDGYDLGVGILSKGVGDKERDRMIASVGPFWDANETWLVLGSGLLLVGFPLAHGVIFQHLYTPVACMLLGLILRGVSFDFRAKVAPDKKPLWDKSFYWGSVITALSQGYMMGAFMTGFASGLWAVLFSWGIGFFALFAYTLVGGAWLLMKTEGDLQERALYWTRFSLYVSALGSLFVAVASPVMSPAVREKWLSWEAWPLYFLPLSIFILFLWAAWVLWKREKGQSQKEWLPFVLVVGIFILNFVAISLSFYPWLIVGQKSLIESAASDESLAIIFVGALICLPVLIGYTIVAYRVFHGKVKDWHYYH